MDNSPSFRQFQFFDHTGYLKGLSQVDAALCDTLLEEAVTDATLAPWFPVLQTAVALDGRAVARLRRSFADGNAPAGEFVYLSMGRATDPLSSAEVADVLRALMGKPDGFAPALQILSMRIHCDRDAKRLTGPELIAVGRELLASMPYGKGNDSQDHHLQTIVAVCFRGEEGGAAISPVVQRFKAAVDGGDIRAQPYDDFLQALFSERCRSNVGETHLGCSSPSSTWWPQGSQ
jgi:hypothetical protein